jgi:hypothetical protein
MDIFSESCGEPNGWNNGGMNSGMNACKADWI